MINLANTILLKNLSLEDMKNINVYINRTGQYLTSEQVSFRKMRTFRWLFSSENLHLTFTCPLIYKIFTVLITGEQQPEQQEELLEEVVREGEEGSSEGAAAALLRSHGITLLPADTGSTVLSALQSGRTVVLSDAGRLLLRAPAEPAVPPAPVHAPPPPDPAPAPPPAKRARSVKIVLDKEVFSVPEQYVKSADSDYLRLQLLAAHAQIASLRRRLRDRPERT